MALVILSHPDYYHSTANRIIIETLKGLIPSLEIRNITELYPDHHIDIEQEQEALLRHDKIIFQHPMYWYSCPAILKSWMDQVLTYQFAHGKNGDQLKSKKFIHSLTTGQTEKNFKANSNGLTMDNFLLPLKKSAEYIQMDYVGPLVLYGFTETSFDATEEKEKIILHVQKLYELIYR